MFWKDGLFKKDHAGTWSFLYYPERRYFIPKTWYFFLGRKIRGGLSQEIHGKMSLCTRTGVTNVTPRPACKKNQRWSYPAKIHLKLVDAIDRHHRKSSSNSLYIHRDLYRRFHMLRSSEKKIGNLLYRIEVLLLQFSRLEIF